MPSVIDIPDEGLRLELGDVETLLAPGALGLDYVPDMGVPVLSRSPVRTLLTARVTTYLVAGEDWRSLTTSRAVLRPGASGEFDNGYAGITGLCRLSGGEILATYHAEDHEGMPRLPSGIAGYYAAVGLALSRDQGETWSKLGPAITSAMPKEWSFYQDQGDRGAGESGALVTRDGRWWYVYYTEHSRRDGRGIVVCVARAAIDELTAGVAEPTSIANCFRKYHDGAFEQPGRGGLDTPVLSIAGDGGAFAMYPHPLWLPTFDRYAMLFNANHPAEHEGGQDPSKSGIHVAFSADALRWRSPTLLVADHGYPITGKSLSWEASLVFDRDDAGEGWLFYSYSPRWGRLGHPRLGRGGLRDPGGVPHHMVGRRLRIEPITSS